MFFHGFRQNHRELAVGDEWEWEVEAIFTKAFFSRFSRNELAATSIEYSLIAAFIALAIAATFSVSGKISYPSLT
jgi:Flp pilus assembly pilin Flp